MTTSWRITNALRVNLVVDDIGVSLSPTGGNGSHQTINDQLYQGSVDLQKFISRKWVSCIQIDSPVRLRAVSDPPPPILPPSPILQTPSVTVLDDSGIRLEIRALGLKLDAILEVLKQQPIYAPSMMLNPSHHGATVPTSILPSIMEEPFIPSQILKPNTEDHIRVTKSDEDSESFDSSASTLRNMRRQKSDK